MIPPNLSPFQEDLASEVESIVVSKGHELLREMYENGEVALKLICVAAAIEVWIYVDGANISSESLDQRFELVDYDTIQDLREAVLARLNQLM